MFAARYGHLELAKYLVSVGANPMIRAPTGFDALGYAASEGHIEVVVFLLGCGGLDHTCSIACKWNPVLSAALV